MLFLQAHQNLSCQAGVMQIKLGSHQVARSTSPMSLLNSALLR